MLQARENLMEAIQAFLKKYDQIPPKEKSMALLLAEERFLKIKQAVEEEQNKPESMQELLLQFSKDLQTLNENSNQLKQEEQPAKSDEHLNTISETESDEGNESSVKNLNLTPSESENLSKDLSDNERRCDLPFLWRRFTGKLAPVDPIPPGIVEANLKEDIRLIEKLLNNDSFPHSLKELNSEIPDAIIKSFSPSLIPIEDSDSLMEEIDIFIAPDDSIPPGIKNDDYDSEEDVLFLAELLNNDYISLPEYESFHVDFYNVPSSPRPPEKPPDDDVYFDIEPDTGVLTTKVVDDIF
ncbi:hypothetical protein Tco_0763708 [Tanacetum coccineum]